MRDVIKKIFGGVDTEFVEFCSSFWPNRRQLVEFGNCLGHRFIIYFVKFFKTVRTCLCYDLSMKVMGKKIKKKHNQKAVLGVAALALLLSGIIPYLSVLFR